MKKKLRSGYTTGACAAAAAKAAVQLLFSADESVKDVEIPFPDGGRHKFKIQDSKFKIEGDERVASASVLKDAGDDPDVTNGAEIVAEIRVRSQESGADGLITENSYKLITLNSQLFLKGGKGVGIVTKPGLSIPVGEPAINPVPRKMIREAVTEGIKENAKFNILNSTLNTLEITISVPEGEELAKKTLNYRLGIVGGISILGTTGIVKPVSTEAWTATITSSMDVAKAVGSQEIVLSAGRTSEKAHMKKYGLPEEAYVLMGDYLEYSLNEAKKHNFKKIHLCAQWAKMVKIAMATPQTHVRFGAIDITKAVRFLTTLGIDIPQGRDFNTAREIFDFILSGRKVGAIHELPLRRVCGFARKYAEEITEGVPVITHLVSYDGEIITTSE